jgi:hypothetical protein
MQHGFRSIAEEILDSIGESKESLDRFSLEKSVCAPKPLPAPVAEELLLAVTKGNRLSEWSRQGGESRERDIVVKHVINLSSLSTPPIPSLGEENATAPSPAIPKPPMVKKPAMLPKSVSSQIEFPGDVLALRRMVGDTKLFNAAGRDLFGYGLIICCTHINFVADSHSNECLADHTISLDGRHSTSVQVGIRLI